MISKYVGHRPSEPEKKTFVQKIFRGFVIIFPLVFFISAVYLIFVKIQKSPILEIENMLAEKKYQKALILVEDSLKESTISRKHILVYGTLAEFGLNEGLQNEEHAMYKQALLKEDTTGIFIEESYLKKMNLFYDSSKFLNILCDFMFYFPEKKMDSQVIDSITKGFETISVWRISEKKCINTIFGSEKSFLKRKIRIVTTDNLNLRKDESLEAEITGSLKEKSKVLVRKKGRSMIYKNKQEYWYYVLTEDGLQGWVFGTYLGSANQD